LYEDKHLLAVLKPPGVATMGLAPGRLSLLTMARQYIKTRYGKPGKVYLGVVSRLDVPVSGVVLFARTSKAAKRLTEQFRQRTARKSYWAIVEGRVRPKAGEYVDWLVRAGRGQTTRVVGQSQDKAKLARLIYRRLKATSGVSLLEIDLETGRKHQIRAQLAHRGHPIIGDRRYGSRRCFPAGIALHARRLVVSHPTTGEAVEIVAPTPPAWCRFGIRD